MIAPAPCRVGFIWPSPLADAVPRRGVRVRQHRNGIYAQMAGYPARDRSLWTVEIIASFDLSGRPVWKQYCEVPDRVHALNLARESALTNGLPHPAGGVR